MNFVNGPIYDKALLVHVITCCLLASEPLPKLVIFRFIDAQ